MNINKRVIELIDQSNQTKKVSAAERHRRRRGYSGTNYRALMIQAQRNKRRKAIERYYTYASIAIGSGMVGVWIGITITKFG